MFLIFCILVTLSSARVLIVYCLVQMMTALEIVMVNSTQKSSGLVQCPLPLSIDGGLRFEPRAWFGMDELGEKIYYWAKDFEEPKKIAQYVSLHHSTVIFSFK